MTNIGICMAIVNKMLRTRKRAHKFVYACRQKHVNTIHMFMDEYQM